MTEAIYPIRAVMNGGVEEGPYRLSYNDDNDGNWWLHFDDGTIDWEVRFTDVEYSGCYFLDDGDNGKMMLNGIEDALPEITIVLRAIAARHVDPEDVEFGDNEKAPEDAEA